MSKKNIFTSFIEKFTSMPLWVKEVIYCLLRDNLNQYSMNCSEDELKKPDLYQYYHPTLTFAGKKELKERLMNFEPNVYKFLEAVSSDLNIIEITLHNYWTLEETAIYNVQCVEKELVTPPSNQLAKAMGLYLANKIRLGEYMKRVGKIDIDKLDSAVRKQKELLAQGQKIGIASILIKLGFINEEDSKKVLYVKDESKKRFILNPDIITKQAVAAIETDELSHSPKDINKIEKKLESVSKENELLKNKIKSIRKILG